MITKQEIRRINRKFRERDDSSLWPIRGAFSVAERAIRQARLLRNNFDECGCGFEYQNLLEEIASRIVNDTGNW